MTNDRQDHRRGEPEPLLGRCPPEITAPTLEQEAVCAGVRAGDAALVRFGASGVLELFVERPYRSEAAPRLVALRSYAELRRALLTQGHEVPATSLVAAAYTPAEIAYFDKTIAVAPPVIGPRSETTLGDTAQELG